MNDPTLYELKARAIIALGDHDALFTSAFDEDGHEIMVLIRRIRRESPFRRVCELLKLLWKGTA